MAHALSSLEGPDFGLPTPLTQLSHGVPILGHVGDTPVVVARQNDTVFAVSPTCTHYGAPLKDGLVTQDGIHCPWHHACFRLADGAVQRGPALNPLTRYDVVHHGDTFVVSATAKPMPKKPLQQAPASITLVGMGAAAMGAAAELRALGYPGPITAFGDEGHMPYDRTKVSKGFLAGALEAEGLAVKMAVATGHGIDWRTHEAVERIDTAKQVLHLAGGKTHPYHAVLLATGASPKRLDVPGAALPHVHVLRKRDDASALMHDAGPKTHVVIVGGSFIGLEAAAALSARSCKVTIITPTQDTPMAGILGDALAKVLMNKHTQAGARFVQGRHVTRITAQAVTLDDATTIACDKVLMAIGVTPNMALAQSAGLATDDGIIVSDRLKTQAPNIWAAGDVARYATPSSGTTARIEHWAVAMRMGQVAAGNMLGADAAYTTTPFFWTAQHGVNVRYVGHAPKASQAKVHGDFSAGKGAVALSHQGRVLAVATVECDAVSLACEAAMDANTHKKIPEILQAAFKA